MQAKIKELEAAADEALAGIDDQDLAQQLQNLLNLIHQFDKVAAQASEHQFIQLLELRCLHALIKPEVSAVGAAKFKLFGTFQSLLEQGLTDSYAVLSDALQDSRPLSVYSKLSVAISLKFPFIIYATRSEQAFDETRLNRFVARYRDFVESWSGGQIQKNKLLQDLENIINDLIALLTELELPSKQQLARVYHFLQFLLTQYANHSLHAEAVVGLEQVKADIDSKQSDWCEEFETSYGGVNLEDMCQLGPYVRPKGQGIGDTFNSTILTFTHKDDIRLEVEHRRKIVLRFVRGVGRPIRDRMAMLQKHWPKHLPLFVLPVYKYCELCCAETPADSPLHSGKNTFEVIPFCEKSDLLTYVKSVAFTSLTTDQQAAALLKLFLDAVYGFSYMQMMRPSSFVTDIKCRNILVHILSPKLVDFKSVVTRSGETRAVTQGSQQASAGNVCVLEHVSAGHTPPELVETGETQLSKHCMFTLALAFFETVNKEEIVGDDAEREYVFDHELYDTYYGKVLKSLLERMLVKDPEARLTFAELQSAIKEIVKHWSQHMCEEIELGEVDKLVEAALPAARVAPIVPALHGLSALTGENDLASNGSPRRGFRNVVSAVSSALSPRKGKNAAAVASVRRRSMSSTAAQPVRASSQDGMKLR